MSCVQVLLAEDLGEAVDARCEVSAVGRHRQVKQLGRRGLGCSRLQIRVVQRPVCASIRGEASNRAAASLIS